MLVIYPETVNFFDSSWAKMLELNRIKNNRDEVMK